MWIPEVHSQAMWLLVLEVLCEGDISRFERWAYDVNYALLSQPLYRAVFGILGARLTVRAMGAAWSSFHRGIVQDVSVDGPAGTVTLRAPPQLMPTRLAPSYATAYQAGLAVAGIKASTAETTELTPTSVTFHMRWG